MGGPGSRMLGFPRARASFPGPAGGRARWAGEKGNRRSPSPRRRPGTPHPAAAALGPRRGVRCGSSRSQGGRWGVCKVRSQRCSRRKCAPRPRRTGRAGALGLGFASPTPAGGGRECTHSAWGRGRRKLLTLARGVADDRPGSRGSQAGVKLAEQAHKPRGGCKTTECRRADWQGPACHGSHGRARLAPAGKPKTWGQAVANRAPLTSRGSGFSGAPRKLGQGLTQ